MENKLYITKDGFEKLKTELIDLKTIARPMIAKKISDARELGDLSENAEYSSAKDEQSQNETKISDFEYIINNCTIIDEKSLDNKVIRVGNFVTLYDEEFDEKLVYRLVGTVESDPDKNYISIESLIGSALIGKKVGEEVIVNAPAGKIVFKVLEISKELKK